MWTLISTFGIPEWGDRQETFYAGCTTDTFITSPDKIYFRLLRASEPFGTSLSGCFVENTTMHFPKKSRKISLAEIDFTGRTEHDGAGRALTRTRSRIKMRASSMLVRAWPAGAHNTFATIPAFCGCSAGGLPLTGLLQPLSRGIAFAGIFAKIAARLESIRNDVLAGI